jgi:hypothetical protein
VAVGGSPGTICIGFFKDLGALYEALLKREPADHVKPLLVTRILSSQSDPADSRLSETGFDGEYHSRFQNKGLITGDHLFTGCVRELSGCQPKPIIHYDTAQNRRTGDGVYVRGQRAGLDRCLPPPAGL